VELPDDAKLKCLRSEIPFAMELLVLADFPRSSKLDRSGHGNETEPHRSGNFARQYDTAPGSALRSVIEQQASKFSVSPAIHPADYIFKFIMEHPHFESDEARICYYFEDGTNSAQRFAELLHKFCGKTRRKPRVLEFASGYGCVTRHSLGKPLALIFGGNTGASGKVSVHSPSELFWKALTLVVGP
jgi:hypothetical protein